MLVCRTCSERDRRCLVRQQRMGGAESHGDGARRDDTTQTPAVHTSRRRRRAATQLPETKHSQVGRSLRSDEGRGSQDECSSSVQNYLFNRLLVLALPQSRPCLVCLPSIMTVHDRRARAFFSKLPFECQSPALASFALRIGWCEHTCSCFFCWGARSPGLVVVPLRLYLQRNWSWAEGIGAPLAD